MEETDPKTTTEDRAPAQDASVTMEASSPGADGDTGSPASAGTETGAGPTGEPGAARPRRRRGRRGGKRHRRKTPGIGGAAASDAGDEGADGDDEATDALSAESASDEAAAESARASTRSGRPAAGARSGAKQAPRKRAPRAATPQADPHEPPPGIETPPVTTASSPEIAAGELATAEPLEDADDDDAAGGPATGAAKKRRRRRRRKKPAGQGADAAAATDGEAAAPSEKASQQKSGQQKQGQRAKEKPAEKQAPASTRLTARAMRQAKQSRTKRPRRKLTEEEAQLLRGGAKTMLVHSHEDRTQIAVLEEGVLIEHYVARKGRVSFAGNIYLGRVQNVLPGMEAAFVDFGRGRNGVLYAGEVNYSPEDLEGAPPRIEKVLRPGQAVMVQVTKDPIGTKGARLTSQISLAGRYLVLAPEQQLSGISRRLAESERTRLRQILREVAPKEHGVIVRTAAEGAPRDAIERDLQQLLKTWDEVTKKAKKAKAPSALYEEPELTMRVVRDIFSGDFEKVVVGSRAVYEDIKGYLDETAPDLLDRLELHDGPLPLFETYRVTEQLHKALERKVWLPSGGSLVIDRSEAMTVIDVNTGKFTGKGNTLEETVFQNNLEAADEVARQLRLRDIGGIIVIDFIDMIDPKHQQEVLRTLKRALSKDKTRSQVFEFSNLGLVEMTRKKVSEGLLDAFSEPCPNCQGRGIVITHEID